MNVLSLFDGMSCGRIALDRAEIGVTNYYAAEVDKHAIKVSADNYPNIMHLGDVTQWKSWDINWGSIDLLIGGSPCQGFSFAGKQLAFNDPRSKLFFIYMDILNYIKWKNPSVKFLLENVKMKKEYLAVITERIGVEPILINSALVSAQNRKRYYWCNWDVEQPEDKGVLLCDIIDGRCQEPNGDGWHKWWKDKKDFQIKKRYSAVVNEGSIDKAICMTARQYPNWNGNFYKIGSMIGRKINPYTGKRDDDNKDLAAIQRIELRGDDKTGALTTVQKDNLLVGNCDKYRNLTPVECERLQTIPDNYTKAVSNSQRYKMLGNGWTVDIIAHILRGMKA